MSCICIIQLKLITNVVYLGLNELDVEGEWLVVAASHVEGTSVSG